MKYFSRIWILLRKYEYGTLEHIPSIRYLYSGLLSTHPSFDMQWQSQSEGVQDGAQSKIILGHMDTRK